MTQRFTAENWRLKLLRHPIEDAYNIDEDIFAVADGVTRDCKNGEAASKKPRGILNAFLYYPKPSPAKIAADIFVTAFPEVLRDFNERDENSIRAAFEEANKRIELWNQVNIPEPNYLANDFAGCVAAGASEQKNIISWGYLCDCGIAIFDKKGNVKFRTEDEGPEKHDKYIHQDPRLKNISWHDPEARRIIRTDYRNNPPEPHSYGVLTGESTALHYLKTGTQKIRPGEHLIVYTDGLEPTIFSGEFADNLRNGNDKALERLCKKNVRTEGTLINHQQASYNLDNREFQEQTAQIARDNLW